MFKCSCIYFNSLEKVYIFLFNLFFIFIMYLFLVVMVSEIILVYDFSSASSSKDSLASRKIRLGAYYEIKIIIFVLFFSHSTKTLCNEFCRALNSRVSRFEIPTVMALLSVLF